MSEVDRQRVQRLLAEALELNAAERSAWLARLVERDAASGREVQALLAAHQRAEQADFLAGPPAGAGSAASAGAASVGAASVGDGAGPADEGPTPGPTPDTHPEETLIDPRVRRDASGATHDEAPRGGPAPPGERVAETIAYQSAAPASSTVDAAASEAAEITLELNASASGAPADAPHGGTLPAGRVPPRPPTRSDADAYSGDGHPPGGDGPSRIEQPPHGSDAPPAGVAGQPRLIADDFEVIEELGTGGMGVVYRAVQHSLRRQVALKIIPTRMLQSAEQVARFYLEAEAAGRLDHPGIVPVQSVGEHDGVHYYAMALVEGGSLAPFVAKSGEPRPGEKPRQRLPARRAAEIIEQVCRAVQFAHDRAVIHRDIKPANILLDGQGRPRLTDFGLAKVTDDDDGLTVTGQVMGTPSYMAPEQAQGANLAISTRTDVYSLGATLYALLAGRPPFTADTLFGTLRKVQEEAPAPLPAGAPQDLATICAKGMAKRPEDRYASAGAMADDLRRFLGGFPISARKLSAPQRATRWARRNPALAALTAAVVLAMAAGTTVSTVLGVSARREAAAKAAALDDARANAQRLSQAIEETFVFASEDLLADEPGMQAARRRLLGIARRYYRELFDSGYGSPAELAAAAFMLGRVQAKLAEHDAAAESFERALALQQAIAAGEQPPTAAMTALARTHNEYARLLSGRLSVAQIDRLDAVDRADLGRWLHHAEQAARWRGRAAAAAPDDGELKRLHANALMNLALAQIEQRRLSLSAPDTPGIGGGEISTRDIEGTLAIAQAMRDDLLQRKAGEPPRGEVLRDTALGVKAMADLAELRADLTQSDAAAAAACRRVALKMTRDAAQRLADLPPDAQSIDTRYNRAGFWQDAGRLSYAVGDPAGAADAFGQMLGAAQELLLQNPRVGRFRTAVAEAQFNLAMLAFGGDDVARGAALLADCQDTHAAGVALNPAGGSLGLLYEHTLAVAQGLASSAASLPDDQANLIQQAIGLIDRARDLLSELRFTGQAAAAVRATDRRLEQAAEAIRQQADADRGA